MMVPESSKKKEVAVASQGIGSAKAKEEAEQAAQEAKAKKEAAAEKKAKEEEQEKVSSQKEQKTYATNIELIRESSWGGMMLDYNVYIDGEKIGEISNDQYTQYTVVLSEGKHDIQIRKGVRSKKIEFNVSMREMNFRFVCKTKGTLGVDLWEENFE